MSLDGTSDQYHRTWLANFFHGFSHLDFCFSEVDDTFNPENEKYREVLELWAALPLACCALLWLAFLVFFCYRCKKSRSDYNKQQILGNGRCCHFFAGLFLLVGCGALAVNFYGNTEVHSGVDKFVHSLRSTNRTMKTSLQMLNTMDRTINKVEDRRVPALMEVISGISNSTAHTRIGHVVRRINISMDSVRQDIGPFWNITGGFNFEEVANKTENIEHFRWLFTVLACCFCAFILFLFCTGLLRRSMKMLIISAVISVIFLPALWTLCSTHLTVSIAGGDLCVDPNSFVVSRLNGTIEKDSLMAYIECEDLKQPHQAQILDAQAAVTQAVTALNSSVNMSKPFHISSKLAGPVTLLRTDLSSMFGNLSSLSSMIGSCKTIHSEYTVIVHAVCESALHGTGYLALCSALAGLCLAGVIICSACTWPYFDSRRHTHVDGIRSQSPDYVSVDDTDPFLPTARPRQHDYGTIGHADPSVVSGINISASGSFCDSEFWDESPQARRPSHLQEYATLAPTPTSIVQSTQKAAS